MSKHNLPAKFEQANFPPTGRAKYVAGKGWTEGWGTTVGNGVQGWSPGAIFQDLDASSGAQVWVNTGTAATATWKAMPSLDAANTFAGLIVAAAGISLPTAQTLAISTPDKLTIGGKIIHDEQTLVSAHLNKGQTSQLIFTLFVARDAWEVTKIDYAPDVANAAGTACVVKAGGTTAPATSSSPMLTAAVGFDLTAAANTVLVGTLTTTTAHLRLTAGDRIVFIATTALLAGAGALTIRGKRI